MILSTLAHMPHGLFFIGLNPPKGQGSYVGLVHHCIPSLPLLSRQMLAGPNALLQGATGMT